LQSKGDIRNGYVSAADLEHQLGTNKGYITRKISDGYFKDVKKVAGRIYLSVEEADRWVNEANSPFQNYTNKDAILSLENYFIQHTERLRANSHNLFYTWITSKISNSHGRAQTVKHIYTHGIELYTLLLKHLKDNNEIYDIELDEIKNLLAMETVGKRLKKELILFYNYALTAKFESPNKRFRLERPSRKKKMQHDQSKERKIYHPKIYQKYYSFVQDIETHTQDAIKRRPYANSWLFVIMHLTNNWRANDIIYQMPNITVENIGVTNLEWFESNKLNTTQAQMIANEVYLFFQNKIANKNQTLLRFYLDPTLLLSFATAMVLCELHSRLPMKSIRKHRGQLLGTFISGKKNEYTTSTGQRINQYFFGNDPELRNFSSLVMNRSTMVYFFHNIVEGSNTDTDVALELTQITRSHLKKDTTAIYVESSNQDGSINRVSINLFNRGHFGWLYNYIINLVMNFTSRTQSLEERTIQIRNFKNEYTPLRLENWSEYILQQNKKEVSLVAKLSQFSEQQLIDLLYKLFKGEMPSKHREGQCLIFPDCENPNRKTCFGCGFFIPKEFLLIEAVSELKKRVVILRNSTLEAVRIRESKIINSILLILSEANKYLGKEKLNSFITRSELNELVDEISDMLLLNEG
jgi:hypothetical protein